MDQQTFSKRLIAAVAIGCAVTLAHLIYLIHLYSNCSILSFIANGR